MERVKDFFTRLVYGSQATALPFSYVAIAFMAEVTNGMTKTSVYTYLPKLVKNFGVTEENTGYVAGYIGSTMIASAFVFSFLIGYLTDRFNKKKVLIFTTAFGGLASLAFGFTTSIRYAVVIRILQGFPGILITAQTLLFEKSDKTNRSIAMAFCLSAFSLGMVVGPAIGGFFAFPSEAIPGFPKGSQFEKYPILLPNLMISCFYFSLSFGTCFLKYTPIPNDEYSELDERSVEEVTIGSDKDLRYGTMDEYNQEIGGEVKTTLFRSERSSFLKKMKKSKLFKVLSNKNAMLCMVSYMLFAFVVTGFNELYPLWAATSIQYNGLGFSTKDIGASLMIACIPLVFLLVVVISKVSRRFGVKRMYIASLLFQVAIFAVFPSICYISNKTVLWIVLIVLLAKIRLVFAACFTAANVIITTSVGKKLLGTVSGLSVAFLNVTSSIAPYAFGAIFSWSLKNIKGNPSNLKPLGFPLNQHLAFFIMAIVTLLVLIVVYFVRNVVDTEVGSNEEDVPFDRETSNSSSNCSTSSSSSNNEEEYAASSTCNNL